MLSNKDKMKQYDIVVEANSNDPSAPVKSYNLKKHPSQQSFGNSANLESDEKYKENGTTLDRARNNTNNTSNQPDSDH